MEKTNKIKLKHLEVETTSEIWRGKKVTFTVFYITEDTACIKGMRGDEFSKYEFSELRDYLRNKGIKEVIFERLVEDRFLFKKVKI